MAQTTHSNVAELNTDLSKQLANLREDIASLTSTVAEYGKAQGTIAKDAAMDKASALAQSGVATASAVKEKANNAYTTTEDAVRANPSAAVGIAVGLGFLVGLLTARR